MKKNVIVNGKVKYIEMTEKEIKENELSDKEKMQQYQETISSTDYKTLKYAEGYYTKTEYAPIKAEREAIREQIRALEEGD